MSSDQIYYTYYSPTDVQHPNKVKYTDNLSAAGDILVTSSSGFDNLNTRPIITSSWGDGIQKQNDFNYNVSITNGFKYDLAVNNNLSNIEYLSASSNVANTIARQLTIDDFNYDTIFGLSKVNPCVIDYNYYKGETTNIFGGGSAVSDKEIARIGPKLFVYSSNVQLYNNYNTGYIRSTLDDDITVNSVNTDLSKSTYNYIANYNGRTIDWNGSTITIGKDTKLKDLEIRWPYKIQHNANQWYQILTNGQKSALLTLPYYYNDPKESVANNQDRFYILNVKKDNDNNPIYSYYKLDKIVENNYYYITSYFDTRPTIKNKKLQYGSNCSSLFNENTIQVLPLAHYDYQTYYAIHNDSMSSCIASCVPVSYTTSNPPRPSLVGGVLGDGSSYPDNLGLNPIPIKYEKNITISTTLNYTIANMTNLSNILTGWNYLPKNFTDTNGDLVRGNLPYINVGIIVYIPTTNPAYNYVVNNKLNSNNCYVKFYNWLKSFDTEPNNPVKYWYGINGGDQNTKVTSENINFSNYFRNIYGYIDFESGFSNVGEIASWPGSVDTSNFYNCSIPAFINFNKNDLYGNFDDKLPSEHLYSGTEADNSPTNFATLPNESLGNDAIKFVNVLCAPVNNALDTTHTVHDNYTFRLSKADFTDAAKTTNTDYFYIIGTYIYLTKNIPYGIASKYPHYLGFSPSTNITTHQLLSVDVTQSEGTNDNNQYTYPRRIIRTFMCDSQNYLSTFNGVSFNNTNDMANNNYYALMKDIFVTPSLFMTINESVGDV